MGLSCIIGQVRRARQRERENSGKRRILKSLLLPCLCICRGRRSSTVPFKMHHALFCFFSKGNEFGSDPKMGYDNVVKKKFNCFYFFCITVLRTSSSCLCIFMDKISSHNVVKKTLCCFFMSFAVLAHIGQVLHQISNILSL